MVRSTENERPTTRNSCRGRIPLANLSSNSTPSPAFSTRSKKLRASNESLKAVLRGEEEGSKDTSICSVAASQESRFDVAGLNPCPGSHAPGGESRPIAARSVLGSVSSLRLGDFPRVDSSSELRDSCHPVDANHDAELLHEGHSIGTPSSPKQRSDETRCAHPSSGRDFEYRDVAPYQTSCPNRRATSEEATPAKNAPFTCAQELQTPENQVLFTREFGTPSYPCPGSDGKVKVYERRKSQQFEPNVTKSCPQFRRKFPSSGAWTASRFQRWESKYVKSFDGHLKGRRGSESSKSSADTSQTSRGSLPEMFCTERRAYFAEVDAFELQEEEEGEEDD